MAKSIEIAEKRKDSLYSDFIFATGAPKNMNGGELVTALDRFYDPPENAPIAISDALDVITARASGEDDSAIKKRVSNLLKRLVE